MRILELYAGIGGCAAAVGPEADVVAAVDINTSALEVYRANHGHPTEVRSLDSLQEADFERWAADLWWMSPPCQPYTRRGKQRDLEDPRAASFLHILSWIERLRPSSVALENVPGFEGSQAHRRLRSVLDGSGYQVEEWLLCPTQLGIPNRRNRFFLVASSTGLVTIGEPEATSLPLSGFVDMDRDPSPWLLDPDIAERYRHAIDVVDPADATAIASCFTSAYGRSPVRSGSYLRTAAGLRRFTPTEVASLLGFPPDYRLPGEHRARLAWRLLGNSLSIHAVRWVMSSLPGFSSTRQSP